MTAFLLGLGSAYAPRLWHLGAALCPGAALILLALKLRASLRDTKRLSRHGM